jgi:predicted anti-sigma-YlaC factor YlaD
MNCEQYQEQISQFMDGELLPAPETELFVHLGSCEQCRTFLKDALALRNTLALTRQTDVPASLDRRILAQHVPVTKKTALQNYVWLFAEAQYTFRTIGLAIVLSALTSVLLFSFWQTSYQPQQTIVCLTPLPEVEVTGYVVVATSPTKGINQ